MKALDEYTVEMHIPEGTIDIYVVSATNLLSISAICKCRHTMIFTANRCEVLNEDGEVDSGCEEGNLYQVTSRSELSLQTKTESSFGI